MVCDALLLQEIQQYLLVAFVSVLLLTSNPSAVLDDQQKNRLAKEIYGSSLTPVSVQQTTSYWSWHVARLC